MAVFPFCTLCFTSLQIYLTADAEIKQGVYAAGRLLEMALQFMRHATKAFTFRLCCKYLAYL